MHLSSMHLARLSPGKVAACGHSPIGSAGGGAVSSVWWNPEKLNHFSMNEINSAMLIGQKLIVKSLLNIDCP